MKSVFTVKTAHSSCHIEDVTIGSLLKLMHYVANSFSGIGCNIVLYNIYHYQLEYLLHKAYAIESDDNLRAEREIILSNLGKAIADYDKMCSLFPHITNSYESSIDVQL